MVCVQLEAVKIMPQIGIAWVEVILCFGVCVGGTSQNSAMNMAVT